MMPARALNELPQTAWLINTTYQIEMKPLPFRVRAEVEGETVLDSASAQVMYELGHAPIYYMPRGDLAEDLLTANDHSTYCPYKGDAGYWNITAGGRLVENAVWAYSDPYAEMAGLVGLVGVYWERMDAWFHDDKPALAPIEIAGRINESNNFAKCHPELAKEWHRERNIGTRPYEYAPNDATPVWWKNAEDEEWQASIMERVRAVKTQ